MAFRVPPASSCWVGWAAQSASDFFVGIRPAPTCLALWRWRIFCRNCSAAPCWTPWRRLFGVRTFIRPHQTGPGQPLHVTAPDPVSILPAGSAAVALSAPPGGPLGILARCWRRTGRTPPLALLLSIQAEKKPCTTNGRECSEEMGGAIGPEKSRISSKSLCQRSVYY